MLNAHNSNLENSDTPYLKTLLRKFDSMKTQYKITCDPQSCLKRLKTMRQ